MTSVQQLELLWTEFLDIQKRPHQCAAFDEAEWKLKNNDRVMELIEEIKTEQTPDYPDHQQILNYEHKQAIEKGVA